MEREKAVLLEKY
jgi:hypothetical protein